MANLTRIQTQCVGGKYLTVKKAMERGYFMCIAKVGLNNNQLSFDYTMLAACTVTDANIKRLDSFAKTNNLNPEEYVIYHITNFKIGYIYAIN